MAGIEWFAFWRRTARKPTPKHLRVLIPRQRRQATVLPPQTTTIVVPLHRWSPPIPVKPQQVSVGRPVAGRTGAVERQTVLVSWALRPATMRESAVKPWIQTRDRVPVRPSRRTVVVPRPETVSGGL